MLNKIAELIEAIYEHLDWPTAALVLLLLGIMVFSFYAESCDKL